MVLTDMRGKILGTATKLFESRGIHASGMDTIIAEAGIAKATLYKYFPTKDQLVMAFLRDRADDFYEWLRESLTSKKLTPEKKLLTLCDLLGERIMHGTQKGLPFHLVSVEFPDPNHPIHKYSAGLAKELQDYFTQLAKESGVKDPESLSQQITMIFEGAALVERITPGTGTINNAKQTARLIIKEAFAK